MSVDITQPRLNGPQPDEFEEYAGFDAGELALDPNDWNQVFVLAPEDGEGYILGRGETRNPLQAEGYVGAHLMDNTATTAEQIFGRYRIAVRTKNNGTFVTSLDAGSLSNIDSQKSDGSAKDQGDLAPLPQTDDEFVTKEYEIVFEVKPNSATTVDTSPDSGTTEFFVDGHQAERTA